MRRHLPRLYRSVLPQYTSRDRAVRMPPRHRLAAMNNHALIEVVRNHKALWDKATSEKTEPFLREKLWDAVAVRMGCSSEYLSGESGRTGGGCDKGAMAVLSDRRVMLNREKFPVISMYFENVEGLVSR